jgi:exodeoxyribonuclease VII large subunit
MQESLLTSNLLDVQDQNSTKNQNSYFDAKTKVGEINKRISWIITHKQRSELGLLTELTTHKSVSVRRKLIEAYRVLGEEADIPELQIWQEIEGDRQTFVAIETAIDAIQRRAKGEEVEYDSSILTVSEALSKIKHVLGEKEYSIEAEITEAKSYGSMYYFTIKDSESEATLNCRCYQNVIFNAGFPLNEGLQIRVTGKFKIDNYSRLLFDIKSIRLTGEGELLRNLKLLQEKLTKEGLLDPSRKRVPKRLPERVLLVASSVSAALTDFQKVLGRRRGGVTIYHLPIKTQGVGAETEIISKLTIANEIIQQYNIDTVVITRGGGSKEDLIVFNSEPVVRAIHAVSKPTIVAIGHERDTSIAELVADVRASTPSQAAELVSKSFEEVAQESQLMVQSIQSILISKHRAYKDTTQQLVRIINDIIQLRIDHARRITLLIDQSLQRILHNVANETRELSRQCSELVHTRLVAARQSLNFIAYLYPQYTQLVDNQVIQFRLTYNKIHEQLLIAVRFELQNTRYTYEQIQAIHPKNILKKGYAMVGQGTHSITRKSDVERNKPLQLTFFDGTIDVEISKL